MTLPVASYGVCAVILFCVLCVPEGQCSEDSFLPSGMFRDDVLFDISWNGPPKTGSFISGRNSKSDVEDPEGVGSNEGEVRLFEEEKGGSEGEEMGEMSDKLLSEVDYQEVDYVDMRTADDEEYRCVVPKINSMEDMDNESVEDEETEAKELIKALKSRCTKLLMGYWTYELCHDKILQQYHEPMKQQGGEKTDDKLDEYILGKAPDSFGSENLELETNKETQSATKDLPVWYYNGHEYPYYQVKMEGGTLCDVKEKIPRSVTIRYICDMNAHASGTFLHIEEVTTCRYDAIVATTSLCQNTAYRLKENPVHLLECYSKDGSPSKPNSLLEHEIIMMNRYLQGTKHQKSTKPLTNKGGLSPEKLVGGEEEEEEEEEDVKDGNYRGDVMRKKDIATSLGDDFIKSFLNGKMCLRGGAGWWQHEVCYGMYVKQIHEEMGKEPVEVLLGEWLEEGHHRWFANAKDRKQSSSHVVHLYMNGDVCDLTGASRQCQVKFRCSKSGSPSKISLFLEEPTSCNYMVTVEAAFLCPLLEDTDEFGMLQLPDELKGGAGGGARGVVDEEEEKEEVEEELDEDGNVKEDGSESESNQDESELESDQDSDDEDAKFVS